MLKYIALMKIYEELKPDIHQERILRNFFKSPVTTDKAVAVNWLNTKIKKYPDASINDLQTNKKYSILATLLAFDDSKCENIEIFLDKFI